LSRVGPPRTLTRSGLRLTKRGIGKPLLGPISSPAATCDATHGPVSSARAAAHAYRAICELRVEFMALQHRCSDQLARGRDRNGPLSSHLHLLQRGTLPASKAVLVSRTAVKET